MKVLRMGLPIVESLSGLQESIFSLFRSPQLHFGNKAKSCQNLLISQISPISPRWANGCLGPWAAVIHFLDSWSKKYGVMQPVNF